MTLKPLPKSIDIVRSNVEVKIPRARFVFGILAAILIGIISRVLGLEIKDSIALTSVCIISTTLWYNALNIQVNFEITQKKIELDKKVIALNLITEWYKDFSEKNSITRKFIHDVYYRQKPTEVDFSKNENIALTIENDPTLRLAVITILNYFEKISLALEQDIADETIIKLYFKDIFKAYFECFYPFIKARQQGPNGFPDAFKSFCQVSRELGANK